MLKKGIGGVPKRPLSPPHLYRRGVYEEKNFILYNLGFGAPPFVAVAKATGGLCRYMSCAARECLGTYFLVACTIKNKRLLFVTLTLKLVF